MHEIRGCSDWLQNGDRCSEVRTYAIYVFFRPSLHNSHEAQNASAKTIEVSLHLLLAKDGPRFPLHRPAHLVRSPIPRSHRSATCILMWLTVPKTRAELRPQKHLFRGRVSWLYSRYNVFLIDSTFQISSRSAEALYTIWINTSRPEALDFPRLSKS